MTNTEPEQPNVKPTRAISPVWLLPIIALVIAAGLAWQAWLEMGPTIEIAFADASGVLPGKTLIRYKDVDVGLVKEVQLSDNLDSVIVVAELNPQIAEHVSGNTRFWVVTPRVSLSGVSGLSTLFSGVYIEMDPGDKGRFRDTFEGLDTAPPIRSDAEGASFTLIADELGALDVGAPVYHRQIRVGEITNYYLSQYEERIHISVFVESPYDELVLKNSRFWNVSGLGFEMGADGFEVQIESLNALLAGGVAFDAPAFGGDLRVADQTDEFFLFPDRDAVSEGSFRKNYYYALRFTDSIRGLSEGAPVEFKGIRFGEVAKIEFSMKDTGETNIQVLIALQPERLNLNSDMTKQQLDDRLRTMIGNGLKARLKTGSLLTGGLFVDLAFTSESGGTLVQSEHFHEIPTVVGEYAQLSRQAADLVHKVNQIPFEKIGKELAGSLEKLNQTLAELQDVQFTDKLDATMTNVQTASSQLESVITAARESLEQLTLTLGTFEEGVAPDSQLYNEMLEMMKRVGEAADSMETLTDELNRYPQSFILGNEARSE